MTRELVEGVLINIDEAKVYYGGKSVSYDHMEEDLYMDYESDGDEGEFSDYIAAHPNKVKAYILRYGLKDDSVEEDDYEDRRIEVQDAVSKALDQAIANLLARTAVAA